MVSSFISAQAKPIDENKPSSRKRDQKLARKDKSKDSIGKDDAASSMKCTMDQTLYQKFNNKNMENVVGLPCFPYLATYLSKYETAIMSEFDREVAYCRY